MAQPIYRVGIVGANAGRAWAHDAPGPALQRKPQFKIEAVSGLQALSSPAIRHAAQLARNGALGDLKLLRVLRP